MAGQFSRLGKSRALDAVTGRAAPSTFTGYIALVTNGSQTINNKALTSNVATLTTAASHGYAVGMVVTVTGVDATFNGTFSITAVTSTTFSYALTAANVGTQAATGTSTVAPTDSTIGVEFAASGYSRQAVAFTAPTAADPPVTSTTAQLTFGPFTAGTGAQCTYAELTDQASAAITATTQMYSWWTLTTPKTPATGDSITVPLGSITLSFTT
jgi:hypothetical protein